MDSTAAAGRSAPPGVVSGCSVRGRSAGIDDAIGWAESVDLYIGIRGADGWSEPEPLRGLNKDGADFGVAASPDGRWLYYKTNTQFWRVDMESVVAPYRHAPSREREVC